jgi:hypothetical protein
MSLSLLCPSTAEFSEYTCPNSTLKKSSINFRGITIEHFAVGQSLVACQTMQMCKLVWCYTNGKDLVVPPLTLYGLINIPGMFGKQLKAWRDYNFFLLISIQVCSKVSIII